MNNKPKLEVNPPTTHRRVNVIFQFCHALQNRRSRLRAAQTCRACRSRSRSRHWAFAVGFRAARPAFDRSLRHIHGGILQKRNSQKMIALARVDRLDERRSSACIPRQTRPPKSFLLRGNGFLRHRSRRRALGTVRPSTGHRTQSFHFVYCLGECGRRFGRLRKRLGAHAATPTRVCNILVVMHVASGDGASGSNRHV